MVTATRWIWLGLLPALTGCFRIDAKDVDALVDADGDGAVSAAFGGPDCDDGDAAIKPGATELCDGVDNDCDGNVDDGAAEGAQEWFLDQDGDGFGLAVASETACEAPEGYVADSSDCNDDNNAVHPGEDEKCNGKDDDCDGTVDEDPRDPGTFYADTDGDDHGDPETAVDACSAPEGFVEDGTDCNDDDPTIHPGADERCDEIDSDCDEDLDDEDALDMLSWYPDADRDGHGDAEAMPTDLVDACEAPDGFAAEGTDCDDGNAAVYPGATELCDGIDNDCANGVDDSFVLVSPSSTYATIQAGIDAAAEGDTVCVEAGHTYEETLQISKDIVLEGQDRDTTIVDGGGAGTTLALDGGSAALQVRRLTLADGDNDYGGAAVLTYSSAAVLEDLLITDVDVDSPHQCHGALIYTQGTVHPTFRRIDLFGNTVRCREVWGIVQARNAPLVTYENIDVRDNLVQGWQYYLYGGFLANSGSTISIHNLIFAGNTVETEDASVELRGQVFSTNGGSGMEVVHATITHNEIDGLSGSTVRGGVYYSVDETGISLTNTTISHTELRNTGSTVSVGVGAASFDHCNVYDVPGTQFDGTDFGSSPGAREADPMFMGVSVSNPLAWDLRLDPSSLLVDAGTSSILDADGTDSDIGAYGGPLGESW